MDQAIESIFAAGMKPASRRRRPLYKSFFMLLRRLHLYAGLLMLPWVLLYGITAFLFNHPTAFSDQPTRSFGKDVLIGTPMETMPTPTELAARVAEALQTSMGDKNQIALVEPEKARYVRDFAFANVKGEGCEISILVNVNGTGGTVRSKPAIPPRNEERPPFAIGGKPNRNTLDSRPPKDGGLKLPDPLHERFLAALPKILERTGFPSGQMVVTSVPDLEFMLNVDGTVWRATYNAQTGAVGGKLANEPEEELSTRRFLLRLHLAHGYPDEVNARWGWAFVVDAMAFVMLFWALSGLVMWWQIKRTRWLGLLVLSLSAAAATWTGFAMHAELVPK